MGKMNCFQLIKSVLDEIYLEIRRINPAPDDAIKDCLDQLSNEYSELIGKKCRIDYGNPLIRFAYVHRYVTCHANIVFRIIQNNQNLKDCLNQNEIDVSCIGGGPGSDFLGIFKYIQSNHITNTIRCYILDKTAAWDESWCDVDKKIGANFRLSTHFTAMDITDFDSWRNRLKHLEANIFTMIYFISEIFAEQRKANDYLVNLFSKAKKESLFLFVDFNDSRLCSFFDDLVRNHEIDIIEQYEGDMSTPVEEDKNDLGEFLEKFGPPKLKSNIIYRVGVKR